MWELAVCILLVLILLYVNDSIRESKETYVSGTIDVLPGEMSDDDITNLTRVIGIFARTNQIYGDFRKMYPYNITPWQFSKLRIMYKKGKLSTTTVKTILGLTNQSPLSAPETVTGDTYSDILGPGTSIMVQTNLI